MRMFSFRPKKGFYLKNLPKIKLFRYFTSKISAFSFDKSVSKIIIVFGILIFCLFINVQLVSGLIKNIISIILIFISLYLSFKKITSIVDIHNFYTKLVNKYGVNFFKKD